MDVSALVNAATDGLLMLVALKKLQFILHGFLNLYIWCFFLIASTYRLVL